MVRQRQGSEYWGGGFVRFDKCLSLHMVVELIMIRTDAWTTQGTVARGQEKNTKKPSRKQWGKIRNSSFA